MPSFNKEQMLEEDKMNEGKDYPFRFGKGFDINLTLLDGTWSDVDGGYLWSLEFESSGAYSINFIFNNFYLPEGAYLYIGNTEGTMLYGPVTSKENTKEGLFLTDLIIGDKVTIYLFEPQNKLGLSTLSITKVIHAYKNIFTNKTYGSYGASGNCNNDILCFPEWSKESDAVALVLLASGTELCSGSLLISTNYSFNSYFLTAFHCIDNNRNSELSQQEISNSQNWLFKFQYKKSACNGNSPTYGITYNSATFRAAWNTSDFALMELNTSLVGDSRFSWLGWNRSGNNPTSGVRIHHPSGDVMKISFDNNNITLNNQILSWPINLTSPINTHWTVNWDSGVTEGGSSGSPLFNQNKRVIGQLNGGNSSCTSTDLRDWYGCFHRSWIGGGTDATRLSNWLDPINSGLLTTNTSKFPSISGPSSLCYNQSGTFSINNLPTGATVSWYANGLSPYTGTGTTFTASPDMYAGLGYVRATVTFGGNVFTLQKDLTLNGYVPIEGPDEAYLSEKKAYFPIDASSGIQWRINGVVVTPSIPNRLIVLLNSYYPGSVFITCTVSTPCGTFEASKSLEIIDDYGFLVYPNPATDLLTVSLAAPAKTGESAIAQAFPETVEPYSIQLWNERSGLVKTLETDKSTVQIPLQGLKKGMYYVHVVRDKKVKKQIVWIK